MQCDKHPICHGRSHQQQGVALVVSLILLIVMTIIGLASIRGITQQERMSNQSYDRSLAFQATEAALREVELKVEANDATRSTLMAAVDGTTKCNLASDLRICEKPATADEPRWLASGFTSWKSLSAVGTGSLAVTPQYFVEYLGENFECQPGLGSDNCRRYRITARSNDGTGSRSYVMLQSIYATGDN
jgi:type IV pilus assembly protein PilX